MSITHVVLLGFKEGIAPEVVNKACGSFLALKDACVLPGTTTPYILSLKGGKDNSIEGLQRGVTHGFVVEFASPVDREYYVNTDPAHQAFKAIIGELVEELKTVVVDFSGGIFN